MATQIQTQANRRSAQLSTGSRTEPGKAISRINALKTGIDARNEAASGEDPADLAHRHIVDTMPSFFVTSLGNWNVAGLSAGSTNPAWTPP